MNKLAELIGKPIRSDRATAQKEMLAYARVLVEVSINQTFPNEISFVNEKGARVHQQVIYECKPIKCSDCGGVEHTVEECRF